MPDRSPGDRTVATNRRARHDYAIEETYEAGMVLTGPEVKSLRSGRASLTDAYARVKDHELWVENLHIPPYEMADSRRYEAKRPRKLLLHRREIDSLKGKVQEKGLTLVPTRLYFKNGRAKVELAVARGKDVRDKRRDIADRDAQRQIERALKSRSR